MAKTKSKRMGSARVRKRTHKKAQSAVEYLLTYSWAILLVALVVAILYLFIFSPQSIVPSSCSFTQGAFCHDLVFGSSTSSSQVAMLLTNKQKFPIVNPSLIVNISKVGSITGNCAPSYVLAGGAMICTLSLPSTALSLGSLVSGNMYLSAIPCPSADEASCQSGTAQTYVGGFNTHVSPILSSTNTLVTLTVQNATQAANNVKDKLTATVKLLGYPVQGATVSFTSNSAAATIYPATITTDADGNAVSYISDSQAEDVKATATFAGSSANTVISFVPAVYIDVETTSMSGVSSPLYSFDGQQYTTNHVFSVNPGSSHSFAFNSLLLNGAGDTQYLYSSTSGCGAISQNGNILASLNCTLLGSYQTQYYLTMGANPAAGALSVSPASGFYNAGSTQTISETANTPYYAFNTWQCTGTGCYSGTTSPYGLAINGPMTENAYYGTSPQYSFDVGSLSGNTGTIGTVVTVDSNAIAYADMPYQQYMVGGSQHTYAYASTVSGGTGVEYTFNTIASSECGQTLQSNTLTVGSSSCLTTASYNTLFDLTMATSGTGSGTISPVAGSTWQQSGNSITITASAATNNYFAGWSGSGTNSYSGSATSNTFTMASPISETATFNTDPVYTFTASSMSSTTANVVTIDGVGYTRALLPVSFHNWAPGSTHTYSYASGPIAGATGTRYVYSSTSGCSQSLQSNTLTVGTSTCTVTGSYTTQYLFTVNMDSYGGGSVRIGTDSCVSSESTYVSSGGSVTISACAANTGRSFYAWKSGGVVMSYNPTSYVISSITAPTTYSASFYDLYTFSATSMSGTGSNEVVNIDGTSYSAASLPYTAYWLPGSTGHIYTFASDVYDGSSTRYTQTGSSTCGPSQSTTFTASTSSSFGGCALSATYQLQYYVTIQSNPSGAGYFTYASSGWYNNGAGVWPCANANTGYQFESWTGTGGPTVYSGSMQCPKTTDGTQAVIFASAPLTETANFGSYVSAGSYTIGVAFDYNHYCGGSSLTASYGSTSGQSAVCAAGVGSGAGYNQYTSISSYSWTQITGDGSYTSIGSLASSVNSCNLHINGNNCWDYGDAWVGIAAISPSPSTSVVWHTYSASSSLSLGYHTPPNSGTYGTLLVITCGTSDYNNGCAHVNLPSGCYSSWWGGDNVTTIAYCSQSQGSYSVSADFSGFSGGSPYIALAAFGLGYSTSVSSTSSTAGTTSASTTSSGGGGGSFVGDTPILMANGQYKEIKDIAPGDAVMSYDLKTGKMFPNVITNSYSFPVSEIYTINNSTVTDGKEMLYTKSGWMPVSDLKVGDYVFNTKTNSYIKIDSLVKSTGDVVVYDLIGSSSNNFIVKGGLLTDVRLLMILTTS